MRVYVLVEMSTGEVRLELDGVEVFDSYEKAIEALQKSHDSVLDDVAGFDIIDNDSGEDWYSVMIDDGYKSEYCAFINARDVK